MKKLLLPFLFTVLTFISFNTLAQDPGFNTNPKKEELITLSTDYGDIFIILSNKTPRHKANFLKLAQSGFYNGTTFHRIIKGFMIQGGDPNSKDNDPNNDGMGSPGYTIPAEFDTSLNHNWGAVAAARMGDNVNPNRESSGSQFYIVENRTGTHFLDKNYTVFGQVIKGMDVVEKIAIQPKNPSDRPMKDIKMNMKVELLKKKKITKLTGYQFPNVK